MDSSISKNSLLYSATSYFNVFMLLLVNIVIAQVLGPEGKGALSLIILLSFFVIHFINGGLARASVYFLGKYKDKEQAILNNAIAFSIVIGCIAGIVFWLLKDFIAKILSIDYYATALGLVAISFPILLLKSCYWYILLGMKRFGERNISVILDHVMYLAGIIILVYFARYGVTGAVVSYVWRGILPILLMGYFFARLGFKPGMRSDMPLLKESLVYGVKSQFGNVLQEFTYKLDMFIVNLYLGVSSVGIYAIAVSVGQILWHFSDAVGNVLFPSVVGKDEASANALIASTSRKALLVTIAGALAILLCGKFMVPLLFGKGFIPSVIPLFILLPGIVAISVHKVLIFGLLGKGHPHYMSYSGIISIVLTLILDFMLIPPYGVNGAALASTIANIVCALFTTLWFVKISGLPASDTFIPRKEDVIFLARKTRELIREAVERV